MKGVKATFSGWSFFVYMGLLSYDNFAFGFAEGHIPRRGGGLGVGQAWKCLRKQAGVVTVVSGRRLYYTLLYK